MMRVCVVGNSHVSMLLGASQVQRHDLELTFFAKPKLSSLDVELDGGRLCCKNDAMQEWLDRLGTPSQIDLADFDAVVFVALSTSIYPAVRITQSHVVSGWPHQGAQLKARLDRPKPTLGRPMITRDTYVSILMALNQRSLGFQFATSLRAVSDVPIYMITQPFPSTRIRQDPSTHPVINRVVDRNHSEALSADLLHSHRHTFPMIENTTYVAQPQHTRADGCLTHEQFMRGARRLDIDKQQPQDDVMHANADLGDLYLQAISKHLKTVCTGQNARHRENTHPAGK